MPDFSIHADFDQDRRISLNASEYQMRNTAPGAVVVPNLDKEPRRLPTSVTNGSAIDLDWKNRSLPRDENDVTRIVIKKNPGAATRNCQLLLKVVGKSRSKVRLYDHRRQRITKLSGFGETLFEVPVFSSQINLYVQVHTLAGGPLTKNVRSDFDDPIIQLQLLCVDGSNVIVEDTALISISPILFMDNMAHVERIYICEIPESSHRDQGNTPSVRDLTQGLRSLGGVRLVKVPVTVSTGDSWLQDQFQIGYCHKPGHVQRVVVHLPRMRSNVVIVNNIPNLASFVETHFPSRNVGLFLEFWERKVADFTDANGAPQSLSFHDSFDVMLALAKFWSCWNKLIWLCFDILNPSQQNSGLFSDIFNALRRLIRESLENRTLFEARSKLDEFYSRVSQEVATRSQDSSSTDDRRTFYRFQDKDLTERYNKAKETISIVNQGNLRIKTQSLGEMVFTSAEANELDSKIFSLHDSTNYGGNLEVTPPVPGAPLGKLLVGSTHRMDSDLLYFLASQSEQPLINIDTSWLDVAHVDEIVTFVSDAINRNNRAAFYASPQIASEILEVAYDLYKQGLPQGHPGDMDRPFRTGAYRKMNEGKHPLTRLLRGKFWWHHHPEEAITPVEPPGLYRRMAEYFDFFAAPYEAGERSYDRYYDASINAREILYFGRFTNDWIRAKLIGPMVTQLEHEAPNTEMIPLPVLFDRVVTRINPENNQREPDFVNNKTVAFTPDLINMQVINGHLFIPSPYGPRMGIKDTITVLRQVMPSKYHSRLSRRYFRAKGLHRTYVWIKSPISGGGSQTDLEKIARTFEDGFPDKDIEEIQDLIWQVNSRQFNRDQDLRSGWRKLRIPENTVDLFQAYTQIVAESLNYRVHWVDSWFYHVRLGGLHCGTNVVRRPRITRSTYWWRAHPTSQINFVENE